MRKTEAVKKANMVILMRLISFHMRDGIPREGSHPPERDHIPQKGSHLQRGMASPERDITVLVRNNNTFDTIYEWWGFFWGCNLVMCFFSLPSQDLYCLSW